MEEGDVLSYEVLCVQTQNCRPLNYGFTLVTGIWTGSLGAGS